MLNLSTEILKLLVEELVLAGALLQLLAAVGRSGSAGVTFGERLREL